MEGKVACEIRILRADNGEVVYEQLCPKPNLHLGGSVKVGESIIIYEHEIL